MVGGLVQKQQVGLGQQQLGQRDAHLPTPRKFLRPPRPVCFVEAQACQHRAHLRIKRVAIEGVKARLQHGVAFCCGCIFGASVVERSHLTGQRLNLRLHRPEFVEYGEALFEDRATTQLQALLRQIADGHAAREPHLSVVEGFQAGQHFHQRGLAGAIGAHESRFLLSRDQPVGILKENPRPKPLARIL